MAKAMSAVMHAGTDCRCGAPMLIRITGEKVHHWPDGKPYVAIEELLICSRTESHPDTCPAVPDD